MPFDLRSSLRTPLRRLLAWCCGLLLFLLIVRLTTGTRWQGWTLAAAPATLAVFLLLRAWRGWYRERWALRRWTMRIVKSWRSLAKPTPIVQVLHLLSVALYLLSVACMLGAWNTIADAGFVFAMTVLAIAGLCDITVLTSRLVKGSWAPTVGKLLALTVCVALAAWSLSLAKQVTYGLAQIDPKYLTEFTAIIACCLIPVVYLIATATVLFAHGAFQFFALIVMLIVGMMAAQFRPFLGTQVEDSLRLFWYRLKYGKRPPGRRLPAQELLTQDEISRLASPFSKLALAAVLTQALLPINTGIPMVRPWLAEALVQLEYRPNYRCKDIAASTPIAHMEDGWVSVASGDRGRYTFSVKKCEF